VSVEEILAELDQAANDAAYEAAQALEKKFDEMDRLLFNLGFKLGAVWGAQQIQAAMKKK
jgi:hypothetical protein